MSEENKRENDIFSEQIRKLARSFASIENTEVRSAIVSFIERIGEFAGLYINCGAILSQLKSEEFFDSVLKIASKKQKIPLHKTKPEETLIQTTSI